MAGTPVRPFERTRDLSLDYLKATLTLMVVAHHSCLAYTRFARSDPDDYLASTAPVVDRMRWLFFDYAENFNDVFFMSLMFFISGLFVVPSLRRSGVPAFLGQRVLRLGLPFAVGASVLMPIAYYASWRAAGNRTSYWDFWPQFITVDGWSGGPLWFIWMLLVFNGTAALLYAGLPGRVWNATVALVPLAGHPLRAVIPMTLVCAAVYLPMLAHFGFGAWSLFFVAPLSFQTCRCLLYLAWFLAGTWIGSGDLEEGLLAREGSLARHWRRWLIGCIVCYQLLVFLPRSSVLVGLTSESQRGAMEAVLWVASCVASCFGFLALFRGTVRRRRPWMDSLARSAYAIYIVHYVFVLWAQYALLGSDLPASIKFVLTFGAAVFLSWLSAQLLLKVRGVREIL